MNKFISIIIFTLFLIASGVVYQTYYRPAEIAPITPTGNVVEIKMRSVANEWRWDPDVLNAKAGDRVILKIFNEDPYDHGFALEAFGVNKRIFPRSETVIEFVVSKPGEFNFYCSVPCGEGHYQHVGQFSSPDEREHSAAACSPDGNSGCHKSLTGKLVVSE